MVRANRLHPPRARRRAGLRGPDGGRRVKVELDVLARRMLTNLPRLALVAVPRWKPRFNLRGRAELRVRS